jgi:ubiquinone/menaquinone biosynthesis C-methylase UbiE
VSRSATIVDYDSNDYDYRTFWVGRDYEQRAEAAVLDRCMRALLPTEWLVDLGAGFGRNYPQYAAARRVALVDYSRNNLQTAGEMYRADVAAGRLHLIRADLNALPFGDGAFDIGVTVRVLHHLPDVDRTLAEMLRVIGNAAVVDVPIKHHVFARLIAVARRGYAGVRQTATAAPRVVGESNYPFYTFHLDAIRRLVDRLGWDSRIAASVNNFRRWDQLLPRPAVVVLNPLVRGLDGIAQRVGRDWWGPNQFLQLRRRERLASASGGLVERMRCPACRSDLRWAAESATCHGCSATFARCGTYWDFTVPSPD